MVPKLMTIHQDNSRNRNHSWNQDHGDDRHHEPDGHLGHPLMTGKEGGHHHVINRHPGEVGLSLIHI